LSAPPDLRVAKEGLMTTEQIAAMFE